MTVNPTETAAAAAQRWPGWPGDNVFRLIVPTAKVGSIIGKGGEIIKKICDDTGARVRILDGPLGMPNRVVLISAKEEPETEVSPAMDAVFRVFKRINDISSDGKTTTEVGICSVKLLMASAQAIHLIGKQGSSIKSIQEESGAVVHVLTGDERAYYASEDERIVDIQGEPLKVLKALEAVIRHIRKFLVDHSMLPLFEKSLKPATQDHAQDALSNQKQSLHSPQQAGISHDYSLSLKRDSLFLDRERQRESQLLHSELSPYQQDPALPVSRFSGIERVASSFVTQVTQTMKIPIKYAMDIIGSHGSNIAYIRGRSGAAVTVLEGDIVDEAVVEIKGTPPQVQTAQQLVEDAISKHKEPDTSGYGNLDARSGPSFPRLTDTAYASSLATERYGSAYPSSSLVTERYSSLARSELGFSQLADRAYPSSLPTRTYGDYGSPGFGGYSSFRY